MSGKADVPPTTSTPSTLTTAVDREERREGVMSLLLGECLCTPSFDETAYHNHDHTSELFTTICSSSTRTFQFLEINGIECISLGSITSELTPMKRVTETVRRLNTNSETPISIGYISDVSCDGVDSESNEESDQDFGLNNGNNDEDIDAVSVRKDTVSIPLDIYSQNVGVDLSLFLPPDLIIIIDNLKNKRFDLVLQKLREILQRQRSIIQSDHDHDNNEDDDEDDAMFQLGITLHNVAAVSMLAGKSQEAIELFQSAVDAKRISFGDDHRLVADSLNELGILYFAQERFNAALNAFNNAKDIRIKRFGPNHPKVAMTTNNIACIEFLLDQPDSALDMFKEAKHIIRRAMGSSMTMVKLDLLHVATVTCNLGYMESRLKNYDEARAIFEEALMVQQSVLDDSHETIKDTYYNIDFTNAFHS